MILSLKGNPTTMSRIGSDLPTYGRAVASAQVRAREAASGRPLFTDPHVQTLLDGLGSAALHDGPGPAVSAQMTTRTKWYDEYFVAAGAAGITQVVILAAGLESRPWRLPWLSDTVIYEIDRPNVLAYKRKTLGTAGAETAVRYVPVPVDADVDWSVSLRAAGFDRDEPTAWSAEGVLSSLTDGDRDRLFDQITMFSGRGSRIAVDTRGTGVDDVNLTLCCRGWEISSFSADRVMQRYHRGSEADDRDLNMFGGFIEGRLG